jgi:hypothetical protein
MTEREKLILHLQNLLKSNKHTTTLDVRFLLGILNALPDSAISKQSTPNNALSVDGGTFYDNADS